MSYKDLPVDDLDLEGDLADDWGMEDEDGRKLMEKAMEKAMEPWRKPWKLSSFFSSEWLSMAIVDAHWFPSSYEIGYQGMQSVNQQNPRNTWINALCKSMWYLIKRVHQISK